MPQWRERNNTLPVSPRSRSPRPGDRREAGQESIRPGSLATIALTAVYKLGPDAFRLPDRFHLGARLGLVQPEHIAAMAVEKGRDPSIGDTVDVNRDSLQLIHDRAKPLEILFGRVLEIDRDMDIRHAEPADAPRLVRQGLFMGVETEVDDMAHPERLDFCELRLGRLTGSRDPRVETMPVVDAFRVG